MSELWEEQQDIKFLSQKCYVCTLIAVYPVSFAKPIQTFYNLVTVATCWKRKRVVEVTTPQAFSFYSEKLLCQLNTGSKRKMC